MEQYDLFVIGAGPGGYVAAVKGAQNGMRVALAECREVGGTCLNRGCIPTKALLHASGLMRQVQQGAAFGICAQQVTCDFPTMYAYKEKTVARLRKGVEGLLEANGVDVLHGRAILHAQHNICVTGAHGEMWYQAKNILLASGMQPAKPPIPGIDLPGVYTSDDLLAAPPQGTRLVIVGGGVIGVEFATIFAALGWQVTMVEAMGALLPGLDREISQNLKMILKKQGVVIHTDARVLRLEKAQPLRCCFAAQDKEHRVEADCVLIATGRKAKVEALCAPQATPRMENGVVCVDERFETNLPGVYAAGDITGGAQLAHAASAQGVAAVAAMLHKPLPVDVNVVPACVYTNPEIACVGLTEAQAKAGGLAVRTGKFLMSANGKTVLEQAERGFIKLVFAQDGGALLGAQLMCERASDIIGGLAVAVANKLTQTQLTKAMAAHPTFYEAVYEAAEDSVGEAVHILPRRRMR